MSPKSRAPRNRTIILSEQDRRKYSLRFKRIESAVQLPEIIDSTICQDVFSILELLPPQSFDLVFYRPPL
jgi:site-specific DNA-methyltransferase (adenine-specific)